MLVAIAVVLFLWLLTGRQRQQSGGALPPTPLPPLPPLEERENEYLQQLAQPVDWNTDYWPPDIPQPVKSPRNTGS
jgi:cell division septation protein DedD